MSKQGCMHLETRFVQSVRHYCQNILYECEKVLSIKALRYIRSTTNILKQFMQNVQSLQFNDGKEDELLVK